MSNNPEQVPPPGNRSRRHAAIILVVVIAATSVTAIAIFSVNQSSSSTGLKVLATFFPLYDFAKNVGGDKVNVSLLVPMTTDVHAFEPAPSDIAAVASADVLIYNGAGLEPWISQVITSANNPKLIAVNTSEDITLLPVPSQYQMENRTIDPHIWLDPVRAEIQVNNILQGLIQADPADKQYFTANANSYVAQLDQLNTNLKLATQAVQGRPFITFHEAFAYFAAEYNVTQIPISGPFEEDPTPGDIANVISNVTQLHLHYVGYESLENPAISQSIASQTNATLIPMNPIEGLTQAEQEAGATYLTLMQQDAAYIVLALNTIG